LELAGFGLEAGIAAVAVAVAVAVWVLFVEPVLYIRPRVVECAVVDVGAVVWVVGVGPAEHDGHAAGPVVGVMAIGRQVWVFGLAEWVVVVVVG
jgi:hypothetical protein